MQTLVQTLRTFFANVRHRLPRTRKEKVLAAFLVFVLVSGVFLAAEPAHAQLTTIGNGLIYGITYIFLALARLAISVSVFFLQLFIELAKYNNFIDAPPVVIGWLMVRDVANMFFVVVLLVIAFGTILGIEQYEWKKTLVKLVLAAIFINFSKLILQLMIDVAHVFTTTFLNAIVGTAGGNLINMFKMDKILQMSAQDLTFLGPGANSGEEFRLDLFIAGVMALIFAIMITVIIGYYLLLMLIRMVVLWVLIILSPVAFIAQVLPTTKSYADEFWKEFTHHVMVAPVAVFFLWLAFATLGSGNITSDINLQLSAASQGGTGAAQALNLPSNPSVSLSDATTWENFASFLIALGFLYVGIDRIQKLGVKGGSLAGGALNFGKKVAAIATGYAAGRWLYEKGVKPGVKGALYHAPLVGGKKWETRGKILGAAVKDWYYAKGQALTRKGEMMRIDAQKKQGELLDVNKQISQAKTPEEKQPLLAKKRQLEEEITGLEEGMAKESAGGLFGYTARKGVQLDKQLKKTEGKADYQEKLLWKRVGSEAGGVIFKAGKFELGIGAGSKGIFGLMGDRYRKDEDLAKLVYGEKGVAAMDRVERGWWQAEEARSKAKDEEFEGLGKRQGLTRARLKFDVNTGKLTYQVEKGSMQDQIAQHKLGGETHAEAVKEAERLSRQKLILGMGKPATVPGGYKEFVAQRARATTIDGTIKNIEDRYQEDAMKEIFKGAVDANFKMAEEERALAALEAEMAPKLAEIASVTNVAKQQNTPRFEGIAKIDRQIEAIQMDTTLDSATKLKRINQRRELRAQLENKVRTTNAERDKKLEPLNEALAPLQARAAKHKGNILKSKIDLGYQFAKAEAEKSHATKGKRSNHNFTLNEAEQREVWNRFGFSTQNQAMDEGSDELKSTFAPFTVQGYTAQIPAIMKNLMNQHGPGKTGPSMVEKEYAIALSKRAAEGGWLADDTIIGLMSDPETKNVLQKKYGIQNDTMTWANARDVMMMYASGGDADFVRDNIVVSELKDYAKKTFGMNSQEYYAALSDGSFTEDQKGKMEAYMRQRFSEEDRDFDGSEVKGRLNDLLRTDKRADIMKQYFKVVRENQPAFQIIAGLRSQQIKNGHPEVAGHAIEEKLGDEILAIPQGINTAAGHWQAEANKADPGTRAGFTGHAQVRALTQKHDQVVLKRDEEGTRLALSGVTDHNSAKKVADREKNFTIGIGGLKESPSMFNHNGVFEFGATKRNDNSDSSAFLELRERYKKEFARVDGESDADYQKRAKMLVTHYQLRDNVSIALDKGGRNVALMRLAEGSDVPVFDAYTEGKVNMTVMTVKGEEKRYQGEDSYNEFVRDYNAGLFNFSKGRFLAQDEALDRPERQLQEMQKREKSKPKGSQSAAERDRRIDEGD